MPSSKVSALTAAAALVGTEALHLVQGGVDRKATVAAIAALASGGGTSSTKTLSRGLPGDDAFQTAARLSDEPLFSASATPFASVYYPFVIRPGDVIPGTLDTYYLFVSSDHDTGGPGGIALLTAPARTGPFTSRGTVFVDTTIGDQSETPAVLWMRNKTMVAASAATFTAATSTITKTAHGLLDGRTVTVAAAVSGLVAGRTYYVVNKTANTFQVARTLGGAPVPLTADATADVLYLGVFFVYYQQNSLGFNQSTALAKSPNGITWTRFGLVIDVVDPLDVIGSNHTGYFKPQLLGDLVVGISTIGGPLALWYSTDGENFTLDTRPLWADHYLHGDSADRFTLTDIVRARGQLWGFGLFIENGKNSIACAPIAQNLRSYLGPVQILLRPEFTWEAGNFRSFTLFEDDGRLFAYYSIDNSGGVVSSVGAAEVL